jgi:hypothetical protein
MAIKLPKNTNSIPNPLHDYASYTYSWSLWWLDVADYNKLMKASTIDDAMSFTPSSASFVVAEDGGVYPDQRQPGTRGLNYHIQEVNFSTTVGLNSTSRSSNMINGSMTIIEPYGITLIDTLIAASFDGTKYVNYTDQPFMLQLNFKGYDDAGNEIPESKRTVLNKRFPIRLLTMKLSVSKTGAEYRLTFVPYGHLNYTPEYANTPKNFNIVAETVEEFFNGPNGLVQQYHDYYSTEIRQGRANFADAVKFVFDPEIGSSKIVDDKSVPLSHANPKVNAIDLKKATFAIPRGTPIVDIITKVMSHSDYLITLQLKLNSQKEKKQTDIFNAFKTVTSVRLAGVMFSGEIADGVFDVRRNKRPRIMSFKIHQYPYWNVTHPKLNFFSDSIPYTAKKYNYWYTGKNTDIIDFKIDFDSTFHNSIIAFTNTIAAESSTENTEIDRKENYDSVTTNPYLIQLNPAVFVATAPSLGLIPVVGPLRFNAIVGDQNITTGFNTATRPEAQVAANVIDSIYTSLNGDMIQLPMTIVGDPTLIKQDDWLYIPDPTVDDDYNKWGETGQAEFVQKYGHVRMDVGEVIVTVTINSPIDLDTDIEGENQGVAFPQPRYSPSLFSGQYGITLIENKFYGGVFEQVLKLYRHNNSDIVSAFNQLEESNRNYDAESQEGGFYGDGTGVLTGTKNDLELTPTNSAPASEQNTGPNTYVLNSNSDKPWVSYDDPRE